MSEIFVLRIREDQERDLYVKRSLYIGIRRDWARGSKIFFVKRSQDGDKLIGYGIFYTIVELGDMDVGDKGNCVANNWYGKILFEKMARFRPQVQVDKSILAGIQPALLHGFSISVQESSKLDCLVQAKIIT